MKELYQSAEMEIVKFSVEDVITTSNDPVCPEHVYDENEGPVVPWPWP